MTVSKMKSGKKLYKKPDPVEESSDGSDSVDAPTQATMKGNRVDLQVIPKQTLIMAQRKGKKLTKLPEPADDSDSNEPSQSVKKVKAKKAHIKPEPAEEPSDISDSEEKPTKVKKKVKGKKAVKRTQSVEEASDDSDSDDMPPKATKKGKGKKAKQVEEESSDNSDTEKPQNLKNEKRKKSKKAPETVEETSDSDPEAEFSDDEKKHKASLEHLRSTDGDFYDFLQEHDAELLKFDDHEEALDDKDDDDNDDDEVHVPGDLHGDSDESDFEAEDAQPIKGKVTLKMVKEWETELQKDGKMKLSTFTHVVKLFNAAVLCATSEDGATDGEYKVAGSSVFNAILNMCVMNLPNAIKKYLGIEQSGKDPQKCKHFVKIKGILVQYLTDLLKLLSAVTSDNILVIMLKHLHQMSKYVACFTRIAKRSIKKLLTLWSTGEETVRVLAFMCILRITRNQQAVLLELVLKAMFMTYVKNCKFVSPTTWPGIHFMRRSLVEMFALDLNVSYPHVFLYVRQLGIHLRNAIVVPKLEHRLAVYNWQYLNSLRLWAELIQHNVHHANIQSLAFPMSMIISNTIKIVPTPQYYPVRFFCIELLMNMANEGRIFIPILPYFLDVITKFDFNKKSKKASMKPLDLSCIIRMSKSQMNENGYKDAVVERLYALLLEYTAATSHSMAFPEICVVLTMQLKYLVKKLTVANYTKKMKQLLDKIEESGEFIRNARCFYKSSLVDCNAINAWEEQIRVKGTPLHTFYENWNKLNKIQKRKNVTKNDELAGVMPLIKRPKISEDTKEPVKIDNDAPMTLFPSDSEDEIDYFKEDATAKEKKQTKKVKKQTQKQNKHLEDENLDAANTGDIVQKKIKKKQTQKKNRQPEDNNLDAADTGDVVQEFSASDW